MNSSYDDIHYSSKLYREETVREANKRRLIALAKAGREQPSSFVRFSLKWSSLTSGLQAPETPR
jgi:hypothetical protein